MLGQLAPHHKSKRYIRSICQGISGKFCDSCRISPIFTGKNIWSRAHIRRRRHLAFGGRDEFCRTCVISEASNDPGKSSVSVHGHDSRAGSAGRCHRRTHVLWRGDHCLKDTFYVPDCHWRCRSGVHITQVGRKESSDAKKNQRRANRKLSGESWEFDGNTITVDIPMIWKRRGGRKMIIAPDGSDRGRQQSRGPTRR